MAANSRAHSMLYAPALARTPLAKTREAKAAGAGAGWGLLDALLPAQQESSLSKP